MNKIKDIVEKYESGHRASNQVHRFLTEVVNEAYAAGASDQLRSTGVVLARIDPKPEAEIRLDEQLHTLLMVKSELADTDTHARLVVEYLLSHLTPHAEQGEEKIWVCKLCGHLLVDWVELVQDVKMYGVQCERCHILSQLFHTPEEAYQILGKNLGQPNDRNPPAA